jgi:signal transduction histidine kinase
MYISYNNIKKRIDSAEAERLTEVNKSVALQLQSGVEFSKYTQGRPIVVDVLNTQLPADKNKVSERCEYDDRLKRKECKLTVSSYFNIKGRNYRITSYNYVSKSKDILGGMLNAVVYKMLLIILAVSLTGRILSRRLFTPFHKTIETLRGFNLRNRQKIQLPETNVKEFKELNTFLKKMTDKAVEDYSALKEFSENASHELQTPLAVIRSKLELLTETNITEGQASLILDMHNAIDKLSRINRSLILLTKLENHEFEVAAPIKICKVANEVLANFSDRIVLKGITVNARVDKNVTAFIHYTLAEILLNNLLSNAVRHNIDGGKIDIHLDQYRLAISNTGLPLTIPAEDLFQRFRKSDQCADSIGLGLAIVKQICDVNGFAISYENVGDVHTVQVTFAIASNRLVTEHTAARVTEPVI